MTSSLSNYGFIPLDSKDEPDSENYAHSYGFTPLDSDGEPIKQSLEKPTSIVQKVASSPLSQAALGGLKKITYPADILKLAMIGEALSDLDELEETYQRAGKPFDRNEYIKKVYQTSQSFPTQQLAEELVKQHTGLDLEPKDALGKIARFGGEIFTMQPGDILNQSGKELGKRAGGSLAGSVIAEGSKKLGVPEILADLAGFAVGGAGSSGKLISPSVSQEASEGRKTAEKHGLRSFAGAETEGAPKVTPVVSKGRQDKLTKELSKSSEEAIDRVITEQLPLKQAEKLGIKPEEVYTRSYQRAEETAKEIDSAISSGTKKPINIQPVLNWIKEEETKIRSSAPSLSDPDKVRLNILKKEYNQLTEKPKQPKVELLAPSGKPLKEKSIGRKAKNINASQSVDQMRNYNENTRDLYRKPEFTGAQQEVRETYAQLNEQFLNAIRNSGEQDLARQLKFGNQVFSEKAKVDQVNSILQKAFKEGYNPSKLLSTVEAKGNKAFLTRNLGKDAVKDLKDIAIYGKRAEKMVLDKLKNPKTIGEYASELTPLKLGMLFLKHGTGLGTIYEISKGTAQRIAGLLYTRPGTRKAYVDFLKGAASPKKGAFSKTSKELSDAIEEEFGSEDNLRNLATENELSSSETK